MLKWKIARNVTDYKLFGCNDPEETVGPRMSTIVI